MKRLITKVFLALGLVAGSSAVASAQASDGSVEVTNKTESFEGITYSTTSLTLPDGWSRLAWTGTPSTHYGVPTGFSTPVGCNTATLKDKSGTKCLFNQYGQTYLYNSSTGTYVDIYDYIVTPQVKGNITFYAKNESTYEKTPALVQLYKMTKTSGGDFTCNPETDLLKSYTVNDGLPGNTTDWVKISYDAGDQYEYIGIRISRAWIDEMTFDSAIFPPKKVLTVSWGSLSSTTLRADADNKVTVSVNATVKNDGNVKLTKATEGEKYTLQLAAYYGGSIKSTIVTKDIPDLEPGEEQTVTITGDYMLPDDLPISSTGSSTGFYVACVEPYNNNKSTNKSATIYPYAPIIGLQYNKNTTSTATTKTTVDNNEIFFGVTKDSAEKTFFINNTGAAPLKISSVEAPEGFTCADIEFPCEIAAGDSKEFKIVLSSDSPGFKSGEIKFINNATAGRNNILVSGETVGADQFFADFETADALSAWYAPVGSTSWKIADYTTTTSANERTTSSNPYWPEYKINDKKLHTTQGTSAPHALYSPLMKFKEGDKISFYAAKRANNSSELTVSYSTDRKEWKQLGKITVAANSANPDLQFKFTSSATNSGQFLYKRFELPIPEAGDYYISLSAGNVNVDNFVGGVLVDVPYDLVAESATIDQKGTVNHPVAYSATFKNIKSEDLEADGQTLTLYANGKAVATSEPKVIEAGKTATFDFAFTPHAAEEISVYAEIKIGEYTLTSDALSVVISPEESLTENKIGKKAVTSSSVPLAVNLGNSISEFTYTANDLASLSSNEISKIAFRYSHTGNANYTSIRIWMLNDESLSMPDAYENMTDKSTMTLVGEYENYKFENTGSSSVYTDMVFDLATPFIYEPGKNLRIAVEGIRTTAGWTAFEADQVTDINRSFYYYNTSATDFQEGKGGTKAVSKSFPVISLFTEAEVAEVSGTVKDGKGKPIEGANVKAESGDVYYEAVSGEDGTWSMTIFQPDREYTVTASAEGYPESEPVALNLTGANDIILGSEEPVGEYIGQYTFPLKVDNKEGEAKTMMVDVFDVTAAKAPKQIKRRAAEDVKYYIMKEAGETNYLQGVEIPFTYNEESQLATLQQTYAGQFEDGHAFFTPFTYNGDGSMEPAPTFGISFDPNPEIGFSSKQEFGIAFIYSESEDEFNPGDEPKFVDDATFYADIVPAPSLYFADVEIELTPNVTDAVSQTVDIMLDAPQGFEYKGFQFNLELPAGVKLDTDDCSSPLVGCTVKANSLDANKYIVLGYLDEAVTSDAEPTAIATITLKATWSATPDYTLGENIMSIIKPIYFSTPTGADIETVEGYEGKLTITEAEIPVTSFELESVGLLLPSYSTAKMVESITAGESVEITFSYEPEEADIKEANIKVTINEVEGLEYSFGENGTIIIDTEGVAKDIQDTQVTISVQYGELDPVSHTFTIQPVELGNSNDSGVVTVADVVTTANYIAYEQAANDNPDAVPEVTRFDFPNANVIETPGKDDEQVIDIADVNATIAIALGEEISDLSSSAYNAKRRAGLYNTTDCIVAENFSVKAGKESVIGVSLASSRDYTSLQATAVIPEGMKVIGVTTGAAAAGHELVYNIGSSKVGIVLYSLNGTPLSSEGAIFNLVVAAQEDSANLTFDNVKASDRGFNTYILTSEGGRNVTGTTGIEGIDADEEGCRYFDMRGIEIPRPDKGIYIRVNANGEAVKVVK